jgi:hypothetical protein
MSRWLKWVISMPIILFLWPPKVVTPCGVIEWHFLEPLSLVCSYNIYSSKTTTSARYVAVQSSSRQRQPVQLRGYGDSAKNTVNLSRLLLWCVKVFMYLIHNVILRQQRCWSKQRSWSSGVLDQSNAIDARIAFAWFIEIDDDGLRDAYSYALIRLQPKTWKTQWRQLKQRFIVCNNIIVKHVCSMNNIGVFYLLLKYK